MQDATTPTEPNPTPEPSGRPALLLGVIAVMLVVAVALGWWALQPGPDTSTPDGPMTVEQAEEELAKLQAALKSLEQGQDAGPLIERVRAFAEQTPQPAPAYELLGQVYLHTGNAQGAYDAFLQSLSQDPAQAGLRHMVGTLAFKLDDYDAAIRHYGEAIELDPNRADWLVYRANALTRRGQPAGNDLRADDDLARLDLLEALRLDPDLYQAHALLAELRLSQNHGEAALESIQTALELIQLHADLTDPEMRELYWDYETWRARIYQRLGDHEAVLQALLNHPHRLEEPLLGYAATAQFHLGQPELAAFTYEQLLISALEPDPDVLANAAHWRLLAEDAPVAAEHIERLREGTPHHRRLPELENRLNSLRTQTTAVN